MSSESHPVFVERRTLTDARVLDLVNQLKEKLAPDQERVIGQHSCIYVTGSAGRGELSENSDIDAFMVRVDGVPSNLDAVILQSALVRALRDKGFPDPSNDGEFLKLHAGSSLIDKMGDPEDDA